MPQQTVKVRIADDALGRMDEIARELEQAGFAATAKLDRLGIILGTCHASDRPALEAIPGVESIRLDEKVEIAPPDATVQ